ncbi:hypothetical protein [Oceanispirochaeta sp.]|jgi:hypothetical protein|uniref:hypothetical protein n=1 Tax=Oceanispirochaeta sp. TaxID=2035350 RepID=UPI002630E2E3|nr:hypothetical protein [Oceanispirochaeta sp.]MDA3958003.1 hypothetical protein [Oceanispirochaeta sp.]
MKACALKYSSRKKNGFNDESNAILLLLLIFLLFGSCSTLNLPHSGTAQVLCTESWGDVEMFLLPGEISLETDLNRDEILKNADQSLNLLIDRQNSLAREKPGGQVEMVLSLREYSYMKDYRLLNTMSLELLVQDREGNCLARYYHAEESKDSFFASSFMYGQLKKGFKKLF